MRTATRWIVPVLVALTPCTMLIAAPTESPSGQIKGEVVAMRQASQSQNAGALTEIQIQTRNRERVWLRLGEQSQFGEQVQVGDRVQARYRRQGPGEPGLVQNMYNYRTRSRLQVRSENGDLVPLRQQSRMGAGTMRGAGDCTGTQQQVRQRRGSASSGTAARAGGGQGRGRGGR